jgi:nucleotide-binding universal stress UspA family protein
MATSEVARPLILVGVDGSPSSDAAVDWAEEYAKVTGGTLRLVTGWHWPATYGYMVVPEGLDLEEEARSVVAKARARLQLPDDRCAEFVVEGAAGDVLVGMSHEADLLVVGSRGHGGFVGALLGSVSSHCVHHAGCPVLVVR